MVLKFPILADYIYLVDEGTIFFITHGRIYNPTTLPSVMPEDAILLTGHTHVAGDFNWEYEDGRKIRYMNPGSPSIPKEDTKPSYIIIENGKAGLYAFD